MENHSLKLIRLNQLHVKDKRKKLFSFPNLDSVATRNRNQSQRMSLNPNYLSSALSYRKMGNNNNGLAMKNKAKQQSKHQKLSFQVSAKFVSNNEILFF